MPISLPDPLLPARLALRHPPTGPWLLRQTWGRLLFMHWPVPADVIQARLPAGLQVDTFDGQAWLAIVPFQMSNLRPPGLPAVPGLSAFPELNVRTYVHLNGVPGVWFFSLDAGSALAVWLARTLFHLPYFRARLTLAQAPDGALTCISARTHPHQAPATFGATWRIGAPLPLAQPGSLAFFLTERYCLYTAGQNGRLYQGHLHHPPWPLQAAELAPDWHSTLLESHGLPVPQSAPLLHAAGPVTVRVWPLRRV